MHRSIFSRCRDESGCEEVIVRNMRVLRNASSAWLFMLRQLKHATSDVNTDWQWLSTIFDVFLT